MQTHDQQLKMIADPESWPRWPLLPMKRFSRAGDWPDFAVVLAEDGYYETGGAVTLLLDFPLWSRVGQKPLKEYKSITYPTPESMLADGWRID